MNRTTRTILIIIGCILALLVVSTGAFVLWANNPYPPMQEALDAMQDDDLVDVQEGDWLVFMPTGEVADVGFIFYPGGLVDYRAYAPLARDIAEQGYLSVITPMPLNLAVFGINEAANVQAAYPEIEEWVIAGHSLGGAMAAQFASTSPDSVDGLAFLAAYPAVDLSDHTFEVSSIYGTNDGVADDQAFRDSVALLPANAVFVPIEGGNHAQFGFYGDQRGDNPATITREEQQAQTVAAILDLLARVEAN
jgi:hypothetical protein